MWPLKIMLSVAWVWTWGKTGGIQNEEHATKRKACTIRQRRGLVQMKADWRGTTTKRTLSACIGPWARKEARWCRDSWQNLRGVLMIELSLLISWFRWSRRRAALFLRETQTGVLRAAGTTIPVFTFRLDAQSLKSQPYEEWEDQGRLAETSH